MEALEGAPPPERTVPLEFPTMQAAIDWYRGGRYTRAREIREGAASARMYVLDGGA